MALDHVNSVLVPQSETVTTSNELDLLFSLMFDELLNGTTQVVSKSSAVTTADAPNQRQQQHTTPSTSTTVATKDHPLEQVIGNPSQSIRTRRQLETDGEMKNFNYFIKEQVEKGIVELFFVGTEYQLADLFTKALSEDRFKYLVRRLGMRCLTPDELEVLAIESA
ncbi:hypothetical protein Tco_0897110 [Tanacetum coccineum]